MEYKDKRWEIEMYEMFGVITFTVYKWTIDNYGFYSVLQKETNREL